ncbi:MAG: hypothetical protein ABMA14_08765 [Hyphomonadaceae bacterium]
MTRPSWTDEQLSAFLDGELPPAETDALARDMESDPQLAARAESLGAANTAFIASAAQIDAMPISTALKAAMEAPPAVSTPTGKILAFRPRSVRAFLVEHRAIAASLLCAVAVGGIASTLAPKPTADPFAPGRDGVILASAPLYQVLESGRTGETKPIADGATATPQLTFASADGQFCRQFNVVTGDGSSAAIACREDAGWRTQVIAFGLPKSSPDYQTASAGRSPVLEAFLDARMSGAPMDAAAEDQLLKSRWKKVGQ